MRRVGRQRTVTIGADFGLVEVLVMGRRDHLGMCQVAGAARGRIIVVAGVAVQAAGVGPGAVAGAGKVTEGVTRIVAAAHIDDTDIQSGQAECQSGVLVGAAGAVGVGVGAGVTLGAVGAVLARGLVGDCGVLGMSAGGRRVAMTAVTAGGRCPVLRVGRVAAGSTGGGDALDIATDGHGHGIVVTTGGDVVAVAVEVQTAGLDGAVGGRGAVVAAGAAEAQNLATGNPVTGMVTVGRRRGMTDGAVIDALRHPTPGRRGDVGSLAVVVALADGAGAVGAGGQGHFAAVGVDLAAGDGNHALDVTAGQGMVGTSNTVIRMTDGAGEVVADHRRVVEVVAMAAAGHGGAITVAEGATGGAAVPVRGRAVVGRVMTEGVGAGVVRRPGAVDESTAGADVPGAVVEFGIEPTDIDVGVPLLLDLEDVGGRIVTGPRGIAKIGVGQRGGAGGIDPDVAVGADHPGRDVFAVVVAGRRIAVAGGAVKAVGVAPETVGPGGGGMAGAGTGAVRHDVADGGAEDGLATDSIAMVKTVALVGARVVGVKVGAGVTEGAIATVFDILVMRGHQGMTDMRASRRRVAMAAVTGVAGTTEGGGISVRLVAAEAVLALMGLCIEMRTGAGAVIVGGRRVTGGADIVGVVNVDLVVGVGAADGGKDDGTAEVGAVGAAHHVDVGAGTVRVVAGDASLGLVGVDGAVAGRAAEAADQPLVALGRIGMGGAIGAVVAAGAGLVGGCVAGDWIGAGSGGTIMAEAGRCCLVGGSADHCGGISIGGA